MTLRLMSVAVENFLNLKAVFVETDRRVTEITGKNGAGKSAFFNAIYCALAGKRVHPDMPIRLGEESARVRLQIGDTEVAFIVTLRITASGAKLTVEAPNGAVFRKPQDVLEQLIGPLMFDPMVVVRMEPKQRLELLRSLVTLDVDLDALDAAYQRDYELRADWNRRAASFKERVATLATESAADMDVSLTDVSALIEQMATAGEQNAAIQRQQMEREARATRAEDLQHRAGALWEEARELRIRAERLEQEANTLGKEALAILEATAVEPELPPLVDVTDLRAQIAEGQRQNARKEQEIRAREQLAVAEREYANAVATAKHLTAQMESYVAAKEAAVARAQMPVEGLGFGNGDITWRGVPFDQASMGEKLKIAVRMGFASNPTLRLAFVRDAVLLDEDAQAELAADAEVFDYYVLLEKTQSAPTVGFHMEHGAVVAIDGVAVAEPAAV